MRYSDAEGGDRQSILDEVIEQLRQVPAVYDTKVMQTVNVVGR